MITLNLDWMDLEIAFRDTTGTESYIDSNTGEIISVVPEFEDEKELREMIQIAGDRYILISPVNTRFSQTVLEQFVGQMNNGDLGAKLAEEGQETGSYARCMRILREDKEALQLYYRFEQNALWDHISESLASSGVTPALPPPEPELFEESAAAAA